METVYGLGIDIGSTTIKIALCNQQMDIVFKKYQRHFADIQTPFQIILKEILEQFGNITVSVCLTGSAGMGISERKKLPFIQEVIASSAVIRSKYPTVKTMVDMGGEDSKLLFFDEGKSVDIRMNGSCAGGTGSFIDQIASLLNIETGELDALAGKATQIYPIASRCGVFSKTDVQNLLSRNALHTDIAASVFHAVSMQVITSLARGYEILPEVFVCGGPFTFLASLREAFAKNIGLPSSRLILSEHSEVIPAWGAAIQQENVALLKLQDLIFLQDSIPDKLENHNESILPKLFESQFEQKKWLQRKQHFYIPTVSPGKLKDEEVFVGIDSGSTTCKIIILNSEKQIIYRYYEKNAGNPLETAEKGLNAFAGYCHQSAKNLKVASACVTGYGEELLKKAFQIQIGLVETLAHFKAASHFNPEVSFILDIGGQDMKAIFIEDGFIQRIEINEACSSGCGSFIETFANSLNHSPQSFSELALKSKSVCDLGTRCTVFMNSKVKQAVREGADTSDIAAGLAFSVVKNCLNKVLKIKDLSVLGKHVMVQGGTFRNQAVVRALEIEIGKEVMISNIPEMMGAFGAALFAIENKSTLALEVDKFVKKNQYSIQNTICKSCENQCVVSEYIFESGPKFYSGNKCENVFHNHSKSFRKAKNIHKFKMDRIFSHEHKLENARLRIGIPRALGMYENFPFWASLFQSSGYQIVLSDISTMKLYESGLSSVMADSICFPAKLSHGHIINLLKKKVDRIFFPFVVHDKKSENQINSYNCPIVTAYSDVLKSAISMEDLYGIPLDSPVFSFKNEELLFKACFSYFKSLDPKLKKKDFSNYFQKALSDFNLFENELIDANEMLFNENNNSKPIILLAGRPYHYDPLIQHKISDIFTSFGADVLTEDIVRNKKVKTDVLSIGQWAFTNRIMESAAWVATQAENVHFVELTSFGCGPDAFIMDEVHDLLKRNGKNATFLKIDDINNLGSVRLRIRSLIESINQNNSLKNKENQYVIKNSIFERKDKLKKILIPWFADFYSPFLPIAFELLGYDAENLPPSDTQSVRFGLKHSNNEICYPATLIVGDFIKAIESGKYDLNEIAFGITQTGGQCRATNYLTLVKRALLNAGYNNIPVISVSSDDGTINDQPGFTIKWTKIANALVHCLVFADILSQLYYASACKTESREVADNLKEKYIMKGKEVFKQNKASLFFPLLQEAVKEFSLLKSTSETNPKIGIVGEIFVKYNHFGNKNLINWLLDQRIQPIVPPLTNFFTDAFVNKSIREEGFVDKKSGSLLMNAADFYIHRVIKKMEKVAKAFPDYHPISNPHKDALMAKEIINLNAQFGEGWRIPAEFAGFAQNKVNNVVSLQPFGCIANQVISKGIEKKVRSLYPALRILSLDFDGGMSDVNIFNRIHFMVQNAKDENSLV